MNTAIRELQLAIVEKWALVVVVAVAMAVSFAVMPNQGHGQTSEWKMFNFSDEFGEETDDRYTVSHASEPKVPMTFPYGSTVARIIVNCDRAWISFNVSPNLSGGEIGDGITRYTISGRIDGRRFPLKMWQSWSGKALYFIDFQKDLFKGSKFDISIPWYEQGYVVFSWNLAGSSYSIEQSCE